MSVVRRRAIARALRTIAVVVPLAIGAAAHGATLLGYYKLEDNNWNGASDKVRDSSGNGRNGYSVGSANPVPATASPAAAGDPGSCGYATLSGAANNGAAFEFRSLPVSTSAGAQTTVAFWMHWDGTDATMPAGWNRYALLFSAGSFGFHTFNGGDVYGVASTGLANGWHHVVAVFTNGSVAGNALWIDGTSRVLTQRSGTPSATNAVVGATLRMGGNAGDNSGRFKSRLDEIRLYNGALTAAEAAALTVDIHSCGAPTPGAFNAFDSGTAAGSIDGYITTRVAGASFTVDVVALNATRTALLTTFASSVKVELLDASNNTGAFDANGCRSTWTAIAGIAPTTLTFAASDAGRKAVTLSAGDAWRDVRLRLSSPATGTATTIACTTDNFAIRPASFASLAATDADWQSAGTARSLANAAASGGNVHKAGQPFTVAARAVNAVGATTVNYAGTPVATASACAGTACSASLGTLTLSTAATAGTISSAATYSEAGSLSLQLQDTSFANVDAGDGSTAAQLTIASSAVTVGRFVPDHFDLALVTTPVLRTFGTGACASRSFTYLGQPFGWATAPQATVRARNAAGATTANYAGALWKLAAASLGQSYAATPASPAVDATALATPSLTSNGDGTGVAAASTSDSLALVRPATPLAPFDADIALSWTVQDASDAGVAGNGTISTTTPLVFATVAFDAGRQMRFGVLKLGNAYGSELLDLPLPIEALHWDGTRFATNTADHCTSVAAANAALANWQRNLAACETAMPTPPTRLAGGRSFLKLARPGAGNNGSVDVALQLGIAATGQTCATAGGPASAAAPAGLPWLQGRWSGAAAYDQNPTARASFGLYRSPLILLRENF